MKHLSRKDSVSQNNDEFDDGLEGALGLMWGVILAVPLWLGIWWIVRHL